MLRWLAQVVVSFYIYAHGSMFEPGPSYGGCHLLFLPLHFALSNWGVTLGKYLIKNCCTTNQNGAKYACRQNMT